MPRDIRDQIGWKRKGERERPAWGGFKGGWRRSRSCAGKRSGTQLAACPCSPAHSRSACRPWTSGASLIHKPAFERFDDVLAHIGDVTGASRSEATCRLATCTRRRTSGPPWWRAACASSSGRRTLLAGLGATRGPACPQRQPSRRGAPEGLLHLLRRRRIRSHTGETIPPQQTVLPATGKR